MPSCRSAFLPSIFAGDRIEELVTAVRNAVQEKVYLSSNISPSILSELIVGTIFEEEMTACLTPREYEVASRIAQGQSIKEIGEHLFISPKTVRVHRTNVMHKFACRNVHERLLQLRQYFPQ